MKTKRIFSLALVVAMLASMFTSVNIVSAQEEPAGDADFDIFKVAGVYYDASEDTSNAGTGVGMHMNASDTHVYDVSTEEGLAAFQADANYNKAYSYEIGSGDDKEVINTTLGAAIETNIAANSATYASYTGGDHAYNFTTYEGKPALHGFPGVATRFVGNWKHYLEAPNMYWKITDDYFASTDTDATFVVQYYDNTGTFNIRYSKQGGGATAFTVTKGGTNTWVTKAFSVTNAMLNKDLTATGLIDNKHTGRFESNSETYISKFAILKTSDYKKLKAGFDVDFENNTFCQFMRNSELVEIEPMNYADVAEAGTDVKDAGISGWSIERSGTGSEGTYTKVVADPSDSENLVFEMYHPGQNWVEGATHISQQPTKKFDANCDSDYILFSYKYWYPTNAYMRVYPTFEFKQYSEGVKNPSSSITNKLALMAIVQNVKVADEKTGLAKTFTSNKYAGKWTEWDYVIDTVNLTADLYIDHEFVLTFDIAKQSGLAKGTYYVSGVDSLTTRFDRSSGAGSAYWDNFQVRAINANQAAAIDDYMTSIPGEINNGTVLPTTTAFTKQAVTWSVVTEDTGVSVAADGTVTVPAEFYGNVEYKATLANGTEKTYSILTCGFRANVVKDTFDEYVYYKGKDISTNPIPGYTVIANEHKVSTIEENPDGPATDLVLKRTQTIGASPTINNTRTINTGDLNSDYILWSVKYKLPPVYTRINLYLQYKDANGNISSNSSAGMNFILRGNSVGNELANSILGRIEEASFENGKYSNKWVEFKVVIDTKNNNGRVYIDDDYLYTHTIIRNRTAAVADGVNVCGIRMAEFQPDWGAGVLSAPAYYDDMSVSTMSTEDTVIADLKMIELPETVQNGTVLPVATDIAGKTITWTADNGITIAADGTVSIPSFYDGNATFTATVNDGTINRTATYTVNKYAEYKFGYDADKTYGMDSYNVKFDQGTSNANYYSQIIDGLDVRNTIIDLGSNKTFYYVVDDPAATNDTAASHEVTKEEYDAFTGLKQAYTGRYFNTSNATGDSAHNRYEAIGPDGDKRPAIMGVSHLRLDTRLSRISTPSMIHFNATPTFTSTDNALKIEVDIYDVGSHIVTLQYRNTASGTTDVPIQLTNTGAWKTFTVELADADFSKEYIKEGNTVICTTELGDGSQDFRFQCGGKTFISAVRVYTIKAKTLEESDYTTVALRDYDVAINLDGTISAKEAITAEQAADAKLYIAVYDETGDLIEVATSAAVTDGQAATIKTGNTTKKFNPREQSIKTFLWDSDLKPYR